MKARLSSPGTSEAKDLWAATYVLMGLRYEREFVDRLLQGVVEMEESATYQAIIEKGIEKGEARGKSVGVRSALLRLGESHFGVAPAEARAALDAINDPEQLVQLILRVEKVNSWQELLGLPSV